MNHRFKTFNALYIGAERVIEYINCDNKVDLKIENYIKQNLFWQTQHALLFALPKEKNILIDFKYQLLASSPLLEQQYYMLNIVHRTNLAIDEEERELVFQKCYELVAQLIDELCIMSNNEIGFQTILKILYLNSCLVLFPPLELGIILQEFKSSLALSTYLSDFDGKERSKTYELISTSILQTFK